MEEFSITPLTDTQIVLFTILFSIASLVGLVGNLIVIIVILFKRELRHFTNYFFVNLSIADIFVLIVCIPTVMQDIHYPDTWIYGQLMCRINFFIEYGLTSVSSLTIILISFERYAAISSPLKVKQIFNRNNSIIAIILIWILSIIFTIPILRITTYEEHVNPNDTTIFKQCYLDITHSHFVYLTLYTTVIIFVPTIFLTILYIVIIIRLNTHYRDRLKDGWHFRTSQSLLGSQGDRTSVHSSMLMNNLNGKANKQSSQQNIGMESNSFIGNGNSKSKTIVYSNSQHNSSNSLSNISIPQLANVTVNDTTSTSTRSLKKINRCVYYSKDFNLKNNRKRFTCVILMVTVAFFCCQLPIRIFILWSTKHHAYRNDLMRLPASLELQKLDKWEHENYSMLNMTSYITRFIYFLHGISNPIIYNISSSKFRRAFWSLICGSKFWRNYK